MHFLLQTFQPNNLQVSNEETIDVEENGEPVIINPKRAVDEVNDERQPVKRAKIYRLDIDLKKILQDHPFGGVIIKIYDKTQELSSICQSYLVDIIILHFLRIPRL